MTSIHQRRNHTQARKSPILSSEPSTHLEGRSGGAEVDVTMQLSSPPPEKSDVPHMLMSPPPEETLRVARGKHAWDARIGGVPSTPDVSTPLPDAHAAKRKRATSSLITGHSDPVFGGDQAWPTASSSHMGMETTPNPKGRKRPKKHVSFVSDPTTPTRSPSKTRKSVSPSKGGLRQSPHASNVKADYVSPSKGRRHSTMPIPPYEPPPERFTPPREIICTPVPTISKSSKRKSTLRSSPRKGSSKKPQLVLQIKKEPPEIDLNADFPPASPSDDPLLLHGAPRSHRKSKRRSSQMIYARDTPPISSSPMRARSDNQTPLMNMEFTSLNFDTDDDDEGPLPPVFHFDFNNDGTDGWSDGDPTSDFSQSGEYTGKFKALMVPTKMDPPSSCTRTRQDAWGHPVSPFPRKTRYSTILESPETAEHLDSLPSSEAEAHEVSVQSRFSGTPRPRFPAVPRSAQSVLPSTPADALLGSPPSDVLPPSSPPPDTTHSPVRDAYEWRELPIHRSDDQQSEQIHREEATVSVEVDIGSDLPIAEYDEEVVTYPPDTPYSESLNTPATGSSRIAAQDVLHVSSDDAMEVVPITIDAAEDEMDVDTPSYRTRKLYPPLDLEQEQDEQQETPIVKKDYPCTPRPAINVVPSKPAAPLSVSSELEPPAVDESPEQAIGYDFTTLADGDSTAPEGIGFTTPGIEEFIVPTALEFSSPTEEDRVALTDDDFPGRTESDFTPASCGNLADDAKAASPVYGFVGADKTDITVVETAAEETSPAQMDETQQSSHIQAHHIMEHADPTQLLISEGALSIEEAEELEDAETVDRELSHEPDFRDDEDEDEGAIRLPRSRSMSQMMPLSSPHNPFHVHSTHQTANQSMQAETSSLVPLSSLQESAMPAPPHREPPRPWPPTPAAGTVLATPSLHTAEADDELDFMEEDPSVIKIVSADPRAAARAAAILKMHKYECLVKSASSLSSAKRLSASRHRDSGSLLASVLKSARRRNLSESGVQKASPQRRHTLGGVIGDKVIIPGSPVITLPQLLKEAETSLLVEEPSFHSPSIGSTSLTLPPKTPARLPTLPIHITQTVSKLLGPREWSKDDWKLLDSCYTDERVLHRSEHGLAPVDVIDLENVVNRFISLVGGDEAVGRLGSSFARDSLLKRARALQRKQSLGNIAPPLCTPSLYLADTPAGHYSTLMSPATSTFSALSATRPMGLSSTYRPRSSLAEEPVRYAQLQKEVHAVADSTIDCAGAAEASFSSSMSQVDTGHSDTANATVNTSSSTSEEPPTPSQSDEGATEANTSHITPLLPRPATLSFASRVKGLIFSYLPRSPRTAPAHTAITSKQPEPQKGLPVPPPEMFKKPRPLITTPAPHVPPKPPHPKDLVRLHPAPSKPSMIPRPTQSQNLRRLVELHPVPPRPSSSLSTLPIDIPRGRRDSTASVKDLVKNFESMEKSQAAERESMKRLELKRKRSIQEWTKANAGNSKPTWRP